MKYIILTLFLTSCNSPFFTTMFPKDCSKPEIPSKLHKYEDGVCFVHSKKTLETWEYRRTQDVNRIIKVGKQKYLFETYYVNSSGEPTTFTDSANFELIDDDNYYEKIECPKGMFL